MIQHISSPNNERLRYARRLLSESKFRKREKRFVVEGFRSVRHAFEAGAEMDFLLVSAGFMEQEANAELAGNAQRSGLSLIECPDTLFKKIAETVNPQGVLAVCRTPSGRLPDLENLDHPALVLVLDAWQDPGNIGTALRTASAARVDAVLLMPGCADMGNPKVVRAAMGAHFQVNALRVDWDMFGRWMKDSDSSGSAAQPMIRLADADAELSYASLDWSEPSILVVGSEAGGLSQNARHHAGEYLRIPMSPGAESLNASTAAAIILFEAIRQREG